MTGVLISFNLGSLVLLIWVFVQGYQTVPQSIRHHIVFGLAATALIVFAQSMTMMYAAAVGRMIRQAVEQSKLDDSFVNKTKRYRAKIFRLGTFTILLVMAHTILGGGAHTRVFPIRVHEILAIGTLLFTIYAVVSEIRYMIDNHLLGHQVARAFEAAQAK